MSHVQFTVGGSYGFSLGIPLCMIPICVLQYVSLSTLHNNNIYGYSFFLNSMQLLWNPISTEPLLTHKNGGVPCDHNNNS